MVVVEEVVTVVVVEVGENKLEAVARAQLILQLFSSLLMLLILTRRVQLPERLLLHRQQLLELVGILPRVGRCVEVIGTGAPLKYFK